MQCDGFHQPHRTPRIRPADSKAAVPWAKVRAAPSRVRCGTRTRGCTAASRRPAPSCWRRRSRCAPARTTPGTGRGDPRRARRPRARSARAPGYPCQRRESSKFKLHTLQKLDSKFGTVRCYPTSVLPANLTPARAGTVRVASRHSRPSVLPPHVAAASTVDPYDLVRRSRLTTAVSEGSGHFRARSASPAHKREPQNGQGAKVKGDHPVGRRSILECDINPYELVSPDASTAGITLVSGQRIRVRPTTTDVDVDFGDDRHAYEDVQLRLTPSAKASSKTTSKRPSSVPTTAKESRRESGAAGQRTEKSNVSPTKSRTKTYSLEDSNSDYFNNQFKSILKKSSIYDDVEANELTQTRSPSPVKRKGCQFYIPTPPSPGYGVKKKVQFLVDDEDLTESVSDEKSVVDKECSNEDDEVFEKVVECKEETQNEPQIADEKTTKRPPSLYRSLSDRMRKDESKISFNDTMALRYLKQRKNLQINFSDLDRLDGAIHRARKVSPRPRVPPPPPPPLPPSKEKEISSEAIKDTVEKPDETVSMEKLDRCINGDITVPSQTAPPPLAPPRKRSNNKPPAVNVTIPPATQRVQVESPTELHVNKTIVRISSPPAVHKLQIKTDYPETAPQVSIIENSQRKTSILINGNDCYSTVNVGDSAPIYQSSVVVMDCPTTTQQQQKKCSSIYITGEFTSPSQETETAPSSETLRELLRDPVEAVRRNLVPHVCGKSDVSRRPRDKKPLRSVKVLPEVRDASLEELSYDAAACDDLSSEHSSSTQYESMDAASDCYTDTSNRSSIAEEESTNRTKFYELLAESAAVEVTEGEDHLYECIKVGNDPIYEEIEIPPPLPSNPPPAVLVDDLNLDKEFTTRSIFEGASKYDILSYLVDAKERGIVQEDQPFAYNFAHHQHPAEEDVRTVSDSSEDSSLTISGALIDDKATFQKPAEIERNDSGVGSETSKSSLSKYRSKQELCFLCEDCEGSLESKIEGEALLCRKCLKKRSERKEIITEIVETEEKYGRDLQIVLEEFYQPMLVAGLLSPDQLSAIFLNVEELLENSQALAEKLRDAVEIASEQGDEDLLSVNTGRLFLEALPMLHAFETYCVRQGAASLLLAGLEKDKELLRIFLRVSQMENAMLRRMNLNSFLMVPVQRVTKYPLLLARLHKVTPPHLQDKLELQEAQHKIELHLSHMNSETKDVPSKLWRRIGSSAGRRSSAEVDLVNIKLRKIAVDVLEWNHEEARFALEGKLLFTQPTDSNWRRGRTIKLTPVNALLVVNGKPISSKTTDRPDENGLVFSRHGAREAALLLVRDKNGRYSLLREPLYLDRCVIAADPAWQSYFEVQELLGRDTFIFKAEDEDQTNIWYKQLQFFAQGMGAWRKRRNALANIMINGMGSRS